MRPQTQANIFVCLLDNAYEVSFINNKYQNGTPKGGGRSKT